MDNKRRIKTVSVVAGTETLVEMPHSHAYIRNIGEEKVYASTSPDITPYDDGVIEIKPNRTKVLANIFDVKKGVGEIYLLSVGDTVCEIESTNVLNFSETVEGGDGSSSGSGSGENGKDGRGILKIAFLSSTGGDVAGIEGAVDTYQITYTDGTKSTYDVTNGSKGADGEKGNGITEVVFESSTLGDTPSIAGSIDTYKIQFENGASTTFEVVNGIDGEQGVSIVSVAINDDKHLIIEFSDGNTQDIGKLPQSDVDLTNYYTINETNDKINTEIQSSLENYVQKDGSKVLSTNDYTTVEKTKLANLTNYDDTEIKNDIIAIQTTVDTKVDKVVGHSLVADSEIEKLSAITNPIKVKGRVNSVDVLPADATIGDLYFVGTEGSEDYKEYVLTEDGVWEQIGVSKIDLSNYVLKKDGYSLVSNTEITRLAEVDNYNDMQIKNDIALHTSSIGMSRKNLFNATKTTETKSGVTITHNSDGSYVINTAEQGATATEFFVLGSIGLSANTNYKLTGAYDGDCSLKFDNPNIFDTGRGLTYAPTTDNIDKIVLRIAKGKIMSNVTIYPMVRYADITDSTYEPYTPSLQEQINDIVARLTALEG